MKEEDKQGVHKKIWYRAGRQRIEIYKAILKSRVHTNPLLKHLYICCIGYYPKAKDHYTYRKKRVTGKFSFLLYGWTWLV